MDAAGAAKGTDTGGGSDDAGKKVSFAALFRYADRRDVLLMLVGTAAAPANGMAQPLMTVIFGQVINAFGGATTDTVLHRVNKLGYVLALGRIDVHLVYLFAPGPRPCTMCFYESYISKCIRNNLRRGHVKSS
ncbi:hypothetical protein BS78_03G243800 [Paspalum vaginatum]|nr:hypothetical protein BS78_03G243800 [Paspalum vaginatum]